MQENTKFQTVDIKSNALLAIPKKGRLFERCEKFLEGAGLDYVRVSIFSIF